MRTALISSGERRAEAKRLFYITILVSHIDIVITTLNDYLCIINLILNEMVNMMFRNANFYSSCLTFKINIYNYIKFNIININNNK